MVSFNDVRAWNDLLSLPKLVLTADARGGRKHQVRIESVTKQKCNRWLEGERASLWNQVKGLNFDGRQEVDEDELRDRKNARAEELLQENLLNQACTTLGQPPPVRVTREILDELKRKHPAARPEDGTNLDALRPVSRAAALRISTEDVERAIRDFSRGSGSGPFGLRPIHLKEALVPGVRDELLRQCTAAMNILAQGKAPPELRHLICGASLVVLPNSTGDHRPVACGDTWR